VELKAILDLLKAVDKTGLSKFELTDQDFSIKMEKGQAESKTVYVTAPPQISAPMGAPVAPLAAPAQPAAEAAAPVADVPAEEAAPAASKGKEITSPLVGIFHRKEVKIGDKLKKGDIVCLIEAMKLMNEITMPEDGEITWIACEDGDSVEFGQLLFNYA
jgi:acetyl-CoA carboxylase biotin carboxyl carrier protein